jgi:hypothetical protein
MSYAATPSLATSYAAFEPVDEDGDSLFADSAGRSIMSQPFAVPLPHTP